MVHAVTAGADRLRFEAAVEPLLDPAYRLAVTLLGDAAAAEDAVQEASFRAWRRWAQLRDPGAVRAWFLRIVANQCHSNRRSRWGRVVRLAAPPAAQAEVDMSELADLRAALRRLDPGDRAVLVLHYLLDLPLPEVATILRLRPAGAKTRLYRALERIRKEMA